MTTQLASPKGDRAPQFSAHFYSGQTARWIKMPFGTEVGLSRGDFVLDGYPAPLPKRGGAPNFRPMSIVAKRLVESRCHLVWRPRPRRHCVRCGPSSPPKAQPPIFGPCLLWPNGCMYQDTTWYGGTTQPRRHYVRWGPSSPPLKGHSTQFSANVRCG